MSDMVLYEKKGKVATIKLNKPPFNTYDHDLMLELGKAIDEVRFDEEVSIAVLTSAIEGRFSAGAEISMLQAADPDYKAMFCLNCQETLSKMESTPKIFIGALNGTTVGGGLEIALATDLRFIADGEKVKIGLPEVNLGVLPGTGGTQRLPRLIGKSRALDLMITGRLLSPAEALEIGLVDRVFPAAKFEAKTMEYVEGLAKGATRAISLIKRSVQEGVEMSLDAGLALERELQNRLFVTHDAKEGIGAYMEKRKAEFTGK